ncbi:MAG: hypothetical protein AAFQ74_04335 [Cyanobacteria bacterium J06623_4]
MALLLVALTVGSTAGYQWATAGRLIQTFSGVAEAAARNIREIVSSNYQLQLRNYRFLQA